MLIFQCNAGYTPVIEHSSDASLLLVLTAKCGVIDHALNDNSTSIAEFRIITVWFTNESGIPPKIRLLW